jgi:hypothetical protein
LLSRQSGGAQQAMLALAADENFNNDIVRGLLRRNPDLNVVCLPPYHFIITEQPAFSNGLAEFSRWYPSKRVFPNISR